eukprot:CAMPEP_0201513240 /NCGR_PEP_ID=MMETSP0161_2-20130828/5336_1 /ASSEMBLY_ACC=CAM_ASM_000251 /TAXON_ID=180227 /ORGANISM="Neoparamoeba aestuarina, Strain SoJaBio B1-5/56/2" /LENGTH=275 /DNA_ID=CAMNT_0047909375 /DNA_START=56 /DNA_END=883 /DNA_ORIENTATION=+
MSGENKDLKVEEEEEEPIDFGKKKKKKAFVPDDEDEEEEPIDFGKKKKKKAAVAVDEDDEEEPMDFGKKKKKKAAIVEDDDEEDEPLNFGKKKATKKKEGSVPVDPVIDGREENNDYDYEFLVGRIYKLLQESNPELGAKEDLRIKIPPPVVGKDGTRKTVWTNFADICKKMGRKPEHVVQYALAEMGTTGSLDAEMQFVIKGRFQQKQIQSVLRHYVAEYVVCKTCRSPDTILKKENRMYFLECRACGSTRSVAAIKTGYQAVVGKRRFQKPPQ